MMTITHNDTTIKVPESWAEVKLGAYERHVVRAKASTARDNIAVVAGVAEIDPELLLDWPAGIFGIISDKMAFVWSDPILPVTPVVKINGTDFIINTSDALTLAEWVDAEEAQKSDTPLSGLLSILARPAGEAYDPDKSERRRRLFEALPMTEVFGALGFFLRCSETSGNVIRVYSILQNLADQLPELTNSFQPAGGGTRLSRIYQTIRFSILTALLRRKLRKFLRSFSTSMINVSQLRRSVN